MFDGSRLLEVDQLGARAEIRLREELVDRDALELGVGHIVLRWLSAYEHGLDS